MFVLAHLSDPHLAPIPKPRLAELMGKRATGFLNWQRKRRLMHRTEVLERIVADLEAQTPDHIAVTGDLVNIALAGEFAPARAWLEGLGSPADVTLVPGNHDAYVRRTAQHAALYWGDYMRGDDGAAFPFVRRRGPLTLIGLSTAVPTAPLLATGRLGPDQLKKVAGLLDQYGNGDSFRVVLIHHPPSSTRSRHLKRLVDGAALRELLKRQGAELVIHGHDHVRSLTFLDGPRRPIPVVGVPSASEAPPGEHDPAGYNLYRIGGERGAWRCEVVTRGVTGDGVVEIERTMLASR
jgi:3',5'-cyclic AMP phosphodiesterase CpdA